MVEVLLESVLIRNVDDGHLGELLESLAAQLGPDSGLLRAGAGSSAFPIRSCPSRAQSFSIKWGGFPSYDPRHAALRSS